MSVRSFVSLCCIVRVCFVSFIHICVSIHYLRCELKAAYASFNAASCIKYASSKLHMRASKPHLASNDLMLWRETLRRRMCDCKGLPLISKYQPLEPSFNVYLYLYLYPPVSISLSTSTFLCTYTPTSILPSIYTKTYTYTLTSTSTYTFIYIYTSISLFIPRF